MKRAIFILLTITYILLAACTSGANQQEKANRNLGTKQNPIKMFFVPSMEAGKVVSSGEAIAEHLHEKTGYYFKVAVPTSYAAVIEALGTYQADIAWLSTYAYILAKQKYDANVRLMTIRNGLKSYRGQFVAKSNSGITSISDIQGKVIAYTDAASTSGYIYPSAILQLKNIKPKEYFFAGGHPQSILSVYSGRADVACSFWSPADASGKPKDAREKLFETYPDVFEKIAIIGYTDWIPNDTVTFRKSMPKDIEEKIVQALLDFAASEPGKATLKTLYDIDGLDKASDNDYEVVRTTLRALNMDPAEMLK
ncbi:MAG: phosphate/phosphite/phosphonate ABC transporter substrate-binding protein [Candidatus Cloacimonetes bacterium HGW-Cloacimonetes-1]|jgi:phosphonate transport system substrate-binding protein|nr:MAG: phosphate/phosphite/phosphonate ABC transporter substrate-binding protein [Candidatus Cloacimonetes bacterium HGW-Cloacimonetes-1]